MIRTTLALAFSSFALGCAWAQEATAPAPRPHRWTIPPIEMERPLPDPREAEAKSRECRRLAASENPAERQRALLLCQGSPAMALPPEPPKPVPRPASPTPVTACDPGGCWDASGSRYTGSGPAMIRNDGKVCQQVGAMMHCN